MEISITCKKQNSTETYVKIVTVDENHYLKGNVKPNFNVIEKEQSMIIYPVKNDDKEYEYIIGFSKLKENHYTDYIGIHYHLLPSFIEFLTDIEIDGKIIPIESIILKSCILKAIRRYSESKIQYYCNGENDPLFTIDLVYKKEDNLYPKKFLRYTYFLTKDAVLPFLELRYVVFDEKSDKEEIKKRCSIISDTELNNTERYVICQRTLISGNDIMDKLKILNMTYPDQVEITWWGY